MQTDYQEFITEKIGDNLIVTINFLRATLKEAKEFRELLNNEFNNGEKKIIVDLTRSNFCDSTFMGALVICSKKISTIDGKYALIVNMGGYIHNLFKTTGLDRAIKIFPDVESAIEFLR